MKIKKFDGIVKRTEGEVRDTIELYRRMRKRIFFIIFIFLSNIYLKPLHSNYMQHLDIAPIHPDVEMIDLDRIVWKVINDPYKPEMNSDEVLRAVHQYRRFLSLKLRYPKANLVPTDDIDLIWHTHILDTENYALDCQKLFGSFLHHYPNFWTVWE